MYYGYRKDQIVLGTRRIDLIRPGMFGRDVAADAKRVEFDFSNETILTLGIPVDFVFIGDSITDWWDVNAYFGRGERYVVNRGIAGDNSKYALCRFEADVLQLKPKHVVIKIGVNDFWSLDGWTEKDRMQADQIISDTYQNICQMVRKAKEHQITPIVCSILPTNLTSSSNDSTRNEAIRELNLLLEDMAEQEGAIYVDFHSRMVAEGNLRLRDELADDGLHPHVFGYGIMANTLREVLDKNGIAI